MGDREVSKIELADYLFAHFHNLDLENNDVLYNSLGGFLTYKNVLASVWCTYIWKWLVEPFCSNSNTAAAEHLTQAGERKQLKN